VNKSVNTTKFYLILWVGCVQILHFVALTQAAYHYLITGKIRFPAPPPIHDWNPQTINFLLGCGITDSILILLTIYFVMTYFFKGYMNITIGLLSMTGSVATALVFAIGTVPTGAWTVHPWSYGIMSILFTPFMILLYILIQQSLSLKSK